MTCDLSLSWKNNSKNSYDSYLRRCWLFSLVLTNLNGTCQHKTPEQPGAQLPTICLKKTHKVKRIPQHIQLAILKSINKLEQITRIWTDALWSQIWCGITFKTSKFELGNSLQSLKHWFFESTFRNTKDTVLALVAKFGRSYFVYAVRRRGGTGVGWLAAAGVTRAVERDTSAARLKREPPLRPQSNFSRLP